MTTLREALETAIKKHGRRDDIIVLDEQNRIAARAPGLKPSGKLVLLQRKETLYAGTAGDEEPRPLTAADREKFTVLISETGERDDRA